MVDRTEVAGIHCIMPRAHRVRLTQLACFAFRLNHELDKGSVLSIDEVIEALEQGKAYRFIVERFGMVKSLDCFFDDDDITIADYFSGVLVGHDEEDFCVKNNGIALLLALTIEMMQKQQWVLFDGDDPPALQP